MSSKGDKEALEAAAQAVEESKAPQSSVVTLSNGVKLRLKPVPPFLVRQAAMKLERPRVPRMDIGKGREEDNPNDPSYLEALTDFENRSTDAALNVMLAAGTEVESIPKGVAGPLDDSWLELLEVLEVGVDLKRPVARYLAWVRYVALATAADVTRITEAMSKGIGLTEEEVEATAESFRNRATRRANKRRANKAP